MKRYKFEENKQQLKENAIDYYSRELHRLLPLDEYPIGIKFSGSSYTTKTMNLNKDFLKAFEMWINKIKNELE